MHPPSSILNDLLLTGIIFKKIFLTEKIFLLLYHFVQSEVMFPRQGRPNTTDSHSHRLVIMERSTLTKILLLEA